LNKYKWNLDGLKEQIKEKEEKTNHKNCRRTVSSTNYGSSIRLENYSSVEHPEDQHGRRKRGEEKMITRRQRAIQVRTLVEKEVNFCRLS
jgi:hypothetical protein